MPNMYADFDYETEDVCFVRDCEFVRGVLRRTFVCVPKWVVINAMATFRPVEERSERFDLEWIEQYECLIREGLAVPPWRDSAALHPCEDTEVDTEVESETEV